MQQSNFLRRFFQVLLFSAALLTVAIGVSYTQRKPPIPDALEIPDMSLPLVTAVMVQQAIHESKDEELLKLLIRANADGSQSETLGTMLGMLYFSGFYDVYRVDHCKAAIWYERSARQGQIFPMVMLSTQYISGQGVELNKSAAVYWYNQASEALGTSPQFPKFNYLKLVGTLYYLLQSRGAFEETKNNVPTTLPPVAPTPVTDIPILDQLLGPAFYNSMGCHAAESSAMQWITSALIAEQLGSPPISGSIKPPDNDAVLRTDPGLMPQSNQ